MNTKFIVSYFEDDHLEEEIIHFERRLQQEVDINFIKPGVRFGLPPSSEFVIANVRIDLYQHPPVCNVFLDEVTED